MDQEKPRRGKLARVVAGSAAVLLVIALGLKAGLITAPPAVAKEPVKTAAFADGGVLEILGVSVGERVAEDRTAGSGWLSYFQPKGSSTYLLGGNERGLEVIREEENGRVLRCRAHTSMPDAMLMEIRLKESNGTARRLPSYLIDHGIVGQDRRLGGTEAGIPFFELKDDSVENLRSAMEKTGLPLLIQHRDPQAG